MRSWPTRVQAAAKNLQSWDGRVQVDFVAPTLFNVFFTFWSKAVADVHFEGATAELLAKQAEGIASRLLADDPHGWFPSGQRVPCIQRIFSDTLTYLTQCFGPDIATWQWGRLHRLPLKLRFYKSKLYISALLPIGIGFAVGVLSAILGVGGGFVLVPAMIYILGMPTAVVIGTSNFQILFVAANVTFLQAATNGTVDVVLALLLILGGVVGAPIGSRLAAKLPGVVLRGLMSVLILAVAVELLTELLRTPSSLYSLGTRQVLP